MTEKLKQTIKEEIGQLPEEMKEAINAFDWIGMTEEIGHRHELEEEEIEDFQLETLLVLVGAVDPEFYAINIENHVRLIKEKAESIAKESFQQIFAEIKKIFDANVRKNLKDKSSDWKQSVDFVLSGGDYSVFLENKQNNSENKV